MLLRLCPLLLLLVLPAGCAGNSDGDCLSNAEESVLGTDPRLDDSDGDGLDDCAEVELGTNPTSPDSDDDGVDDGDEIACVSNPNDPSEVCYSCGWEHNDPGDLESTGSEVGDTVRNLNLWDQCGEELALWDLAGEYHILYLTAAW